MSGATRPSGSAALDLGRYPSNASQSWVIARGLHDVSHPRRGRLNAPRYPGMGATAAHSRGLRSLPSRSRVARYLSEPGPLARELLASIDASSETPTDLKGDSVGLDLARFFPCGLLMALREGCQKPNTSFLAVPVISSTRQAFVQVISFIGAGSAWHKWRRLVPRFYTVAPATLLFHCPTFPSLLPRFALKAS